MSMVLPDESVVLEEAYANVNTKGEEIHPLQALPEYDRKNARAYEGKGVAVLCKEIANWFTSFTGTKTLRAYAWIKALKGYFPTKGSSMFAFVWEADETTGKKAPVGKPIGYRMWAVFPNLDLNDHDNVVAYDKGEKSIGFDVAPMSSIIGLKKTQVKASEYYSVPRLLHKNFIIVDQDKEADGTVIVTRVRANYYLRFQFKNKEWKIAGNDGKAYDSAIYAGAFERKSVDCTDAFLQALESIEGKDLQVRIRKTLESFFVDPVLRQTKLGRIMHLQARSLAGAHVDSLPNEAGSDRREFNLTDRVAMYSVHIQDAYHGVDHPYDDPKDEFLDYHCRLIGIYDPTTQKAQGLEGHKRLNDGVALVINDQNR